MDENEESFVAPPPQRILVPPPDIDELDLRFSEAEFDPLWLLSAVPLNQSQEHLERQLLKLTYHQSVVESQLLDMVNMNYDNIVAGMQQTTELKTDLTIATIHVGSTRQALQRGENRLTKPVLTILSKVRKKARILTVYRLLKKIQNLFNLFQEVELLLSQNKLHSATKAYLQCSRQLEPLTNVSVLAGVRERNQATNKHLKKRLAATLSGLCSHFDVTVFISIVKSYVLLEDAGGLGQLLRQTFLTSVGNGAKDSVIAHVQGDLAELGVTLMSFDELCALVPGPNFWSCFRNTAGIFAAIMKSAYKVSEALSNPQTFIEDVSAPSPTLISAPSSAVSPSSPTSLPTPNSNSISINAFSSSSAFTSVSFCDILREAGALVSNSFEDIWARVQQHLTDLLIRPITVPLDEFVQVVTWGYQLIAIGEAFSKSHYDGFKNALMRQSQEYVKKFHRESFEYLRTTLEAESWRVLPLGGEFRLTDIKEFRNLLEPKETAGQLFERFLIDNFPFENASLNPSSPENNEDKEVRLVTAASLTVARFIGKYLHIMRNIESMAEIALQGVTELFEFYLYCVFTLFGISANQFFSPTFKQTLYPALRKAVLSVKDRVEKGVFGGGVFRDQMLSVEQKTVTEEPKKDFDRLLDTKKLFSSSSDLMKVKLPASPVLSKPPPPNIVRLVRLNETVDLMNKNTLWGSVERAIASESIIFLMSVLKENQLVMTAQMPTKGIEVIKYAETVARDFRTYMYRNIAPFLIPLEPLNSQLANCKWDLQEPCAKPNAYVNTITATFEDTGKALAKLSGVEQLPNQVRQSLWTEVVAYLIELLLGAYSKIKKCTTEGRGLLSLDLNQLKASLESITQIHLTHWSHVTDYATAFYLPHDVFMQWVREHPSYTMEQYVSVWLLGPAARMDPAQKIAAQKQLEQQVISIQQAKLKEESNLLA